MCSQNKKHKCLRNTVKIFNILISREIKSILLCDFLLCQEITMTNITNNSPCLTREGVKGTLTFHHSEMSTIAIHHMLSKTEGKSWLLQITHISLSRKKLSRCLTRKRKPDTDRSSWYWKAFCMLPGVKGNDQPS